MGFRQTAKMVCAASAVLLCIIAPSFAVSDHLLHLTQKFPDITGGDINASYDHTTGIFEIQGFSEGYSSTGETPTVPGGADTTFDIHAVLNPSTGALISGTITANGKLPAFGANSGLLLTGDLTNFGWPTANQTLFEFLFHPTGGDLNIAPNGVGGVILDIHGLGVANGQINFGGDFTANFRNADPQVGGNGNADVFPAPEPASMGLICMSLAGLLLKRSRRSIDQGCCS